MTASLLPKHASQTWKILAIKPVSRHSRAHFRYCTMQQVAKHVTQLESVLFRREFSSAAGIKSDWWKYVEEAPKDPILGVSERFLADTSPDKMNLGVGAYRDDHGKPVVLQSVREAERRIAGREFMEYLPIGGSRPFVAESIRLAYGADATPLVENRIAAVQSLSGTGACRLMAEFQKRYAPQSKAIYYPAPTWSNHISIWQQAGLKAQSYRYYKHETRGLDLDGLLEDLHAAPRNSFFLLHACAHNPTGVDPTPQQWAEISRLMAEKGHFAFFDMAYQGFASGDCDKDAIALRQFVKDGHRVGLAQSFAKNMGLYGHRIGCFSLVCGSEREAAAVESQIKAIARPMYSNPPLHGALLVTNVLKDAALNQQWRGEVKGMADRIIAMRRLLRQSLEAAGSTLSWNHITDQIGMFCYTGMTPEQVDQLYELHIYLTRNGRISMAGVNTRNVEQLAAAIHRVTKKK